jgi:Uma2 family endonuclease
MPSSRDVTWDEYVAFLKTSEIKYELIGGVMYAMASAGRAHNRVSAKLMLAIGPAAFAGGCEAVNADQLVRVGDTFGWLPDFGVYCNDHDGDGFFRTDPCLLAEVVSPSSHERDKVTKLSFYKAIASLQMYLVADPVTKTIIAHSRGTDDRWSTTTYGLGDSIRLPCPPMILDVESVFS